MKRTFSVFATITVLATAALLNGCSKAETEGTATPGPGGAVSGKPTTGGAPTANVQSQPGMSNPNDALNNPNVPDYAKAQIRNHQQGQGGGAPAPR